MKEYILPILIFLGFGALSGILLLIASKVLAVKTDETEAKITEALPGANCGGCGYSGCAGYAAAVAHDGAPTNLCKPGGADVMKKINAIMGTEGGAFIREVAYVRCNGCEKATKDRFTFTGTKSCAAVEKFYNGKGECRFGCDGYGDCAAVCGNDAITITDGVAVVDPAKCGGCGKCVTACPNHLIFLRKETSIVALRCSSKDSGKVTRTVCTNGCIGCKICEKKCPHGAVIVADNHAVIDYDKCTSCGTCVSACPRKCLVNITCTHSEKAEQADN